MMKATAFRVSLLTGLIILFAGAFVVPSAGFADLNQGLVGYWNFDEGSGTTAHDGTTNHNDGTIYGGPTWVDGKSGKALYFDGSDDYVDIPDADILSFGNGSNDYPFTFTAWIKRNSFSKGYILSKYNSSVDPRRQEYTFLVGNDSKLYVYIWDTPTSTNTKSIRTTATIDESWHFVAARYDGSSNIQGLNLYIDGILRNTEIVDNSLNYVAMHNTTESFKIGRATDNNGEWYCFNGIIDEVRIYDRALSEKEICQLYNLYGPWDQNKLFFDPVFQTFTLYFTDGDADACHDPGEPYFAGPDPNANTVASDMSCWMASASNIMQHECQGNYYLSWLRDGAAASPNTSPWGDVKNACAGNGGDHMTFDDGGWQHWALAHAGCLYSGPITTTTEFGTWNINPIDWCRNRIATQHLIGLIVWWGTPPPGALPGWIGHNKLDGYHAITLGDIDTDTRTLTITDSDDQLAGQRVVSYTFTNNDWVIQNLYPGVNGHVNYAVSSRSEGDGDVNNDGVINVSDVVYLTNYLFAGGPAPVPLEAGDVNCDGMINASDVVYLINYLFISGPPPGC